nr:hypothetical protein Iba_chr09dCG16290 [Ipomoea batatas]
MWAMVSIAGYRWAKDCPKAMDMRLDGWLLAYGKEDVCYDDCRWWADDCFPHRHEASFSLCLKAGHEAILGGMSLLIVEGLMIADRHEACCCYFDILNAGSCFGKQEMRGDDFGGLMSAH